MTEVSRDAKAAKTIGYECDLGLEQTPAERGCCFSEHELITKAVKKVPPQYPPAAWMFKQFGVVKLQIVINEEGRVMQVKVEYATSKELQKSALEAIRQWRFAPTGIDGKRVKAAGQLAFMFSF